MIQFGIDQLLTHPPAWKSQRIGLVTNHAATTHQLVPSRKALLENGFAVRKLFSPEHGLDVRGADGHKMTDGMDLLTGLPVISLYSNKLAPSEEDLSDIDLVLFDIPDVGSRFYTYLWTLTYVMEACALYQKKLIILDRPNPVSGNMKLAEGPILEASQASFIGRWAIPVRHSATLGELATYFNHTRNIHCSLEIIGCTNWERTQFQPDWGTPFVATSPAIKNFESMLLYPGLCLLEATNISEGRGTGFSFCAAGAPWINGRAVASMLNETGLDEIIAVPIQFTPTDPNAKYVHQTCNGVKLEIRDAGLIQAVSYGLLLIRLIKQLYPDHFQWKPYPTLVNPTGTKHLDKLLGIPDSESLFDLPLHRFLAATEKITRCSNWGQEMAPYLLYS
jgi:uncharacterized protein YbbC (DUF1343 family)